MNNKSPSCFVRGSRSRKSEFQWNICNLIKQLAKIGGVNETRNMEHSGTSRNIPEHRIIIINMSKICKIKSLKIKSNKNKLVSARKIKTNQKHNKKRREKERTLKWKWMQWVKRLPTKKSNLFLPVVRHQFNHVTVSYSQISFFTENQGGGVRTP